MHHVENLTRPGHRVRLGVALTAAAGVGALATVPYQLAIAPQAVAELGLSTAGFTAMTVASGLAGAAVAVAAGLSLGPRIGIRASLLEGLVGGDRNALVPVLRRAMVGGIALGGVAVAIDLALASSLPTVTTGEVSLAARWLASLYGAINEELLLRLGVVTVIAWVGSRLLRQSPASAAVKWVAVVVAALGFGLAHLPAVAAVTELTPLVVMRTVGLNALLGIGFGALYLQSGLLAAMTAHFAADLVIQTAAHYWL